MLVGFVLPIILNAFGQSEDSEGEEPATENNPVMDIFEDRIKEITPHEKVSLVWGFIEAISAALLVIYGKAIKNPGLSLLIAITGILFIWRAAVTEDLIIAAALSMVGIFCSLAAFIPLRYDAPTKGIGSFVSKIAMAISIIGIAIGLVSYFNYWKKATKS